MKFEAIAATMEEDAFGHCYSQNDLEKMEREAPGVPVLLFFGKRVGKIGKARAEPGRLRVWGEADADLEGLYCVPRWNDGQMTAVGLVKVPLDPFLTPVKELI